MSKGNVREAALDVLLKVEKNQAYSHLLLNDTINKNQLSPKDTGLFTELVYGTIQHKKTLDFYISPFVKKPLSKLDDWVRILLELTVYQTVFLDRIPERAAFFEAVQIAKKRGHKGISGMVNGVLRSMQREGIPDPEEIKDPIVRLSVETSHPEWLVERWTDQYGFEKTKDICEANLIHPKQTARVNGTKATVEEVFKMLEEDGVEAEKSTVVPEAFTAVKGVLSKTRAFKEGYIAIQDESSMLVAHALGAVEGERVLDACAAPGGKSTHIAETMNGKGEVESLDIHKHKVSLIEEQAGRLDLNNIKARVMDAREAKDHFEHESFDRILVDAPCSGLGVIKRKPDLKWTKTQEDVKRLASIQADILRNVWPLLKQGGTLVYSTCTIDREENDNVIEDFLKGESSANGDHNLYSRLPENVQKQMTEKDKVQIFPGDFDTDGFFISAITKG
ncbi:16S rRNA (cytosine(967)-C(5))-methyltransferase RsmB [Bacillus sp. H-16]|uniref:16S rRNA (cytosine(967)-C(5))-methyltransferase RsmB n=1 Tax=Alteribacter salitolerans TaxID=2912333 RepID=UPI001965B2F3|nr:16S rRNA (cytosine(967)-C(5))-methyltransferase RsmB [Alteribacter salitolerans]MBM7094121.1 16S rRNA (cytosine(967)-C(5))-methyltransferase RsmB [Alteribacter salitolerans]